jgi:hypothetical protein
VQGIALSCLARPRTSPGASDQDGGSP